MVGRADLTDALATFLISPTSLRAHSVFTAGQYCVLGLNNTERPNLGSVRRAMSIASAPEADLPLEFYIRYVARPTSENPLTHFCGRWGRALDLPAPRGWRIHHQQPAAPMIRAFDVMVRRPGAAPFVSMITGLSESARRLSKGSCCTARHADQLGYRQGCSRYRRRMGSVLGR
jgi:ferredoxin--NADP+ reductase